MSLTNDQELANTERKLALLEQQIEITSRRPPSDANTASLRSLSQMANQLQEEIVRYRARRSRAAG